MTFSLHTHRNPEQLAEVDLCVHRLLAEKWGGLIPRESLVPQTGKILDVACATGSWVFQMGQAYPSLSLLLGTDPSDRAIEYACTQTWRGQAPRIAFMAKDLRHPDDHPFPYQDFDLIRLAFCTRDAANGYGDLLENAGMHCRPGGTLLLVEGEWTITNSPAFEEVQTAYIQSLSERGYTYSPDSRHMGLIPFLHASLMQAGCQSVESQSAIVDIAEQTLFSRHFQLQALHFAQQIKPLLVHRPQGGRGILSDTEYGSLLTHIQRDVASYSFSGILFFTSVFGRRRII